MEAVSRIPDSSDPKLDCTKPIQEKLGKYGSAGKLKPWKTEAPKTTASPLHLKNLSHLQPLHLVEPLCRVGDFRLEKGGKAERGRGIMLISSPYNSTSNCISKRFVSPLYNVGLYRVCVGLGVFLMCLLEQACYHRIVSKGFLERYAYVYLCITGLYSKVYRSDSNKSFVLGVLWLLEHIRTSCEGLIKIFDIV